MMHNRQKEQHAAATTLAAKLDEATAARERLQREADAMGEQLSTIEAVKPKPTQLPPRSTASLVATCQSTSIETLGRGSRSPGCV